MPTLTMNWITEDLAVGDIADSKCHEALREMGIDVVIDVRCHFEETARMYPYESVWWCAEAVNCLTDHGFTVMVFCEAGQERSPFIAMLCLYLKGGKPTTEGMMDAYKIVAEKRPQTLIQDEWINHLWSD